jgi:hypothetical protein
VPAEADRKTVLSLLSQAASFGKGRRRRLQAVQCVLDAGEGHFRDQEAFKRQVGV